ncbi:MAG: phosphoribosylaminoimidazolesuccinocarboxamide synthase [Chloroflexota bacterium]|nr:phosphoribosylaminoimidazolesuccinocarboxamide synthase [Chloroflexota bacterium]
MSALSISDIPALRLVHRGKVRDTYEVGPDRLLLVATDRISAFDVVFAEPIPGKGEVLTRLSAFWFERLGALGDHHFISMDPETFPEEARRPELAGRAMLVRRARRIDIECVVRGYLAGSGWAEYRESGTVAGHTLPAGLGEAERLPEPIFTPATKAETGHDENITRAQLAELVGPRLAAELERRSLALYEAGRRHLDDVGLILADTKFEFGLVDGTLTLIDEVLTPDSSRFWDRATYHVGASPPSYDKQYVRDHLIATGWNREPPPPRLPSEVIEGTSARYAEALARITGQPLSLP